MRWRKPCFRFRLLTFGWNVLFISNPGEIDRTWTCLNLKTTKSSAEEGYCGPGRRSKARFLREKNPMGYDPRASATATPDWGKVTVGLDNQASRDFIKDEMRGLDSVTSAIHTR
jgi:hypothetical protein